MVHFKTVSLTLWLGATVYDKAVFDFVGDANMLITLSGWSQSLLLIDISVMLLIFAICQAVTTHITGNRFDLVMANALGIVDVVVRTPLGTLDHCFVSCVLRVEQSVPEYNVKSTIFLMHRTNWSSVRSAVNSFTLSTNLKSTDPLVACDRATGEVIARYFHTTVLRSRSGDEHCLMPAARELMMLNRLLIVPGVEHAMLNIGANLCFLVLRPRGSMVLHGSLIMNAPKIL